LRVRKAIIVEGLRTRKGGGPLPFAMPTPRDPRGRTNCDDELVSGVHARGGDSADGAFGPVTAEPDRLDEFDLSPSRADSATGMTSPRAGSFAMRVRERLYPASGRAIDRGLPIIGVCNGFQVLVQVAVAWAGRDWPGPAAEQSVALTENAGARFVDRWSRSSRTGQRLRLDTWAGGDADVMQLPVAHGEVVHHRLARGPRRPWSSAAASPCGT